MAAFEDRVAAAADAPMDKRYQILAKLDPELAKAYAIDGIRGNAKRLAQRKSLTGFGVITKETAEAIWEAVIDDDGADSLITEAEEEALCILIDQSNGRGSTRWTPDAKKFLLNKIERNLRDLWSVTPIGGNTAAQYLSFARRVNFESKGEKHKGTGITYTPQAYQDVLRAIRNDDISAWSIPNRRVFRRTNPDTLAVYYSNANDIFLASGSSGVARAVAFVHEATHAIQDFHNIESQEKYFEVDAHIADAVAAWTFGVPYYSGLKTTEGVATRTAAKLLMEATRGKTWAKDFRLAYDEVVDVYTNEVGAAYANKVSSMEEKIKAKASYEKSLLTKVRAAVKGKPRRR